MGTSRVKTSSVIAMAKTASEKPMTRLLRRVLTWLMALGLWLSFTLVRILTACV